MILTILDNKELIQEIANKVISATKKKQSEKQVKAGIPAQYELNKDKTAENIVNYFRIKSIEEVVYLKVGNSYKTTSRVNIESLISNILMKYKYCSFDLSYNRNEIYRKIISLSQHPRIEEMNPYNKLIPFNDGVLNLETMKQHYKTNDDFTTYQIPCNYFSNTGISSTKLFDEFISTLAGYDPEEDETKKKKRLEVERLLKCFVGYTLSGKAGYKEKSCIWLYGAGNTGKSQYFKLIEQLIGKENTFIIDFADLQERFRTAGLLGKRFAGSPECSDKVADGVNKFKSISGGDSVTVENKGQNPFQMVYTGTLLFCSNNMPRILGDTGNHVYKRIVPVECTNIIPKEKQNQNLIEDLMKENTAIVKECLQVFKECGERLPELSDAEERRIEFKKYNSNVLNFAYDYLIFDNIGNEKNRFSYIYEKYSKYCEGFNLKPVGRIKFSQAITSEFGENVIFKGKGNEVYFKARIKEGLLKELGE